MRGSHIHITNQPQPPSPQNSPAHRISPSEALKHPFLTQSDAAHPPQGSAHATAAGERAISTDSASTMGGKSATNMSLATEAAGPVTGAAGGPKSPRVAATTATTYNAGHHHGQPGALGAGAGVGYGAAADAGTQT